MQGIDLSKWNGKIDFKKVKESGVDFVILRAGYGKEISQKDPRFEEYYREAKKVGLHVGAYWYSYATTVAGARAEALTCMQVLAGKQFDFPIFYDVEEKKQFALGGELLTEIVYEFLTTLERAGFFAGLYMSKSPLTSYMPPNIGKRFALWVAQYAKKCTYKGDWDIWQSSSKGSVPGISGRVDLDTCELDFPTLLISKHYNGY